MPLNLSLLTISMADVTSGNQQPPQPLNQKSGNKSLLIIGGIIVLLIIGGWIFFGRDANDDAGSLSDTTEEADNLFGADTETLVTDEDSIDLSDDTIDSGPAAGVVQEFTVAGSNFAFDPAEMRVQAGDTVRITLTNDSPMPHDWRLDEFNAATEIINTGETDTIEFVASQAGEFEYYCSVGNHRAMGMVGTLIVE